MNHLLCYLFLFSPVLLHAQFSGVIADSATSEGIPYVNIWILDKNTGASSDLNGRFEAPAAIGDSVTLSAVGYEQKRVVLRKYGDTIFLKRSAIELDEVVVKLPQFEREQRIGSFNPKDILFFMFEPANPILLAQYIPNDSFYASTPFLKEINIITYSRVKNAKFIVRLYKVGEDGFPGEFLYDQNIYALAKKGRKMVSIDLSDLAIKFPEEGFYLGLQTLGIEENYFKYNYRNLEGEKKTATGYSPSFGQFTFVTGEPPFMGLSKNGTWKEGGIYSEKPYRYFKLAAELVLTD